MQVFLSWNISLGKVPETSSDPSQGYTVCQVTLAFLMLRVCHLLFYSLPLACSSGNLYLFFFFGSVISMSLWKYFSFFVLMLLFLCCCSHNLTSANPDTVVMACFHEKNQLPEKHPFFSPPFLIH